MVLPFKFAGTFCATSSGEHQENESATLGRSEALAQNSAGGRLMRGLPDVADVALVPVRLPIIRCGDRPSKKAAPHKLPHKMRGSLTPNWRKLLISNVQGGKWYALRESANRDAASDCHVQPGANPALKSKRNFSPCPTVSAPAGEPLVTWDKIKHLAALLRRTKSREARMGWALAALLSMEAEDRDDLVAHLKAPKTEGRV